MTHDEALAVAIKGGGRGFVSRTYLGPARPPASVARGAESSVGRAVAGNSGSLARGREVPQQLHPRRRLLMDRRRQDPRDVGVHHRNTGPAEASDGL